jgi:spore coat polysaccharide biosynthesis predicted glycosyltransferase SpsG
LWEAAALGVPSIGLIVADNQSGAAQTFLNSGLIDLFDGRNGVQIKQIAESVETNLVHAQKNSEHLAVIGEGADLVAHKLTIDQG